MNKKWKIAAGLALLSLIPTAAMAHTDVSIGLNLGGNGYYQPAPVYVAPPPVYYREEAPVVYYGSSVHYDHRDYGRRDWHDGYRDQGHRDRDRRGDHDYRR